MREINEHKYLDALIEIGLNLREARIYLSLLTRHDFSVTEIAKSAKLSRPAAYELLNKMVMLGICKEKPGKVKRFMAISPGVALPNLIENEAEGLKTLLANRQNKIGALIPVLEDLFKQSRGQEDPLDYFEVLRDRKQIAQGFLELERQVTEEMQAFVKPPYSLSFEDNVEESNLLKRGVKVRGLYEYDGTHEEMVKLIEPTYKLGEDARVIRSLPTKLAIFDCKITLLALNDPIAGKASITTLRIYHKDFSILLKEAFESYWAKAIPFAKFKDDPSIL